MNRSCPGHPVLSGSAAPAALQKETIKSRNTARSVFFITIPTLLKWYGAFPERNTLTQRVARAFFGILSHYPHQIQSGPPAPKPQAATVLLRMKHVMASVKPALIFLILRPSDAAENVKNLLLPQVKKTPLISGVLDLVRLS